MKIAPIDIAHKNFERKLMGINSDEVMDFLRNVADQMEDLIRERNTLKEQLREKDMQIHEYRERDETLKNTITTATKMSDRITADADREAKLIIHDASQKAEMIIREARDSLKRIYQDVADLKKTRLQFEQNLRALVQAHLAMIDQSHSWMPDPQVSPAVMQTLQSLNQNPAQVMAQPIQPAAPAPPVNAGHAPVQVAARAGFKASEPTR